MDFGFYLPCYWPDTSYHAADMYRDVVEEAQAAEAIGCISLSIPEHHFINYLVHPSPLLTAVQVAAATRRIPIVTAVLVLPFYDMRRLAGEIAQADCLTGGAFNWASAAARSVTSSTPSGCRSNRLATSSTIR